LALVLFKGLGLGRLFLASDSKLLLTQLPQK
jgi:hypothetical protein